VAQHPPTRQQAGSGRSAGRCEVLTAPRGVHRARIHRRTAGVVRQRGRRSRMVRSAYPTGLVGVVQRLDFEVVAAQVFEQHHRHVALTQRDPQRRPGTVNVAITDRSFALNPFCETSVNPYAAAPTWSRHHQNCRTPRRHPHIRDPSSVVNSLGGAVITVGRSSSAGSASPVAPPAPPAAPPATSTRPGNPRPAVTHSGWRTWLDVPTARHIENEATMSACAPV